LLTLAVVGCATTDDLRRLRGDLNYQIRQANDKIAAVELDAVGAKGEVAALRKDMEKTGQRTAEEFKSLRSVQAEGRVDVTEVRDQLQQIRGSIDGLRKDLTALSTRTSRKEEEEKALREKIDSLTFKINFIENFLSIGKKEETAEQGSDKNGKSPVAPPPAAAKDAGGKAKTDKESLYAAAYELFREGKYDKSREAFEHFLKQFPETELSDNAMFWIGECYYFEKKYEKAIVEYEKVTKSFPEGNKTPYALLKQGLSFLKLGDKASAKLLLQQVIKDYPNTSQARIARAKLLEIK
jgi:tol-pal system protein YbgF